MMVDFPTWFSSGCYGGLACCMLTIAANALYTSMRQRGTTRQLTGAIVISVVSALLLLPALVWYNMRFAPEQSTISLAEIQVSLVYIALCGWLLPLSVTASYYLFTLPRTSTASLDIPSQKRSTRANDAAMLRPPRYQQGVPSPFVFTEDIPWGWLEYRNGNFQGQRLELKRVVITLGRDEDNDIWIDDDMASRHHAELAYDQDKVYITDCDSLNGVLLNGRRIHGSALVESGELLEVGAQRFTFLRAKPQDLPSSDDDPLAHHTWRSSLEGLTGSYPPLPPMQPREETPAPLVVMLASSSAEHAFNSEWQETASLDKTTPPPTPLHAGTLIIRDGEMKNRCFLLDRPIVTIGRGTECDVLINDVSISRCHAQFLRQAQGDFVQDLTSRNGTKVNNEALLGPRLLVSGDIVSLGSITLEYTTVQTAATAPLPLIITPRPSSRLSSGPVPLRLPSRPKP